MYRGFAVVLILGMLVLAATPAAAQFRGPRGGDQESARHGWLGSLEEGKAEAKKTGKPLMVVLRCVP